MNNQFLFYLGICSFVTVILSYIFYGYFDLKKNAKEVFEWKLKIEECLDRRFKIYETMIEKLESNYNNTALKEIVQLRSYSQTLKENNDTTKQFETEEKITKTGELIFTKYPEIRMIQNFTELERQNYLIIDNIESLKEDYNNAIIQYNKKKFSLIGSIMSKLFPKISHDFTLVSSSQYISQKMMKDLG